MTGDQKRQMFSHPQLSHRLRTVLEHQAHYMLSERAEGNHLSTVQQSHQIEDPS